MKTNFLKIFFAASLILLVSSCSKDSDNHTDCHECHIAFVYPDGSEDAWEITAPGGGDEFCGDDLEDAEKLYGLFIIHGFSTFDSLYNIPWRTVENMGLSQDLMAWLSAWLPKSYNEETPAESFTPLLGHWEDCMGGRRCTIKEDYSEESKTCIVEEQDSNRKNGKIGVDYEDPANVLLEAPWGKNGGKRTWWGRIENNGTRIRWKGRRGESFWHKIA